MTADRRSISRTDLHRRTLLQSIGVVATGLVGASAVPNARAADGSYTRHTHSGLEYTKYVPGSVDDTTAVPLVVMLHGCTQTADDFADGTRMNEVADENDFIVCYPEQSPFRHYSRCWQWFNDANTTRGQGEAAIIAGMVEEIQTDHAIDGNEVYAAGLSAGGAMVPNLVVEYADVFSGAGIHSGLQYDAAENAISGVMAMTQCSPTDPQEAGTRAYDRMEEFGITTELPTIVFHGTDDATVAPCNGEQATEQATQTNDLAHNGSDDGAIDGDPDETYSDCSAPNCATVSEYHDSTGRSIVEHWSVNGMGHAWSGGTPSGSYTDPDGPDASLEMWAFFAADGH